MPHDSTNSSNTCEAKRNGRKKIDNRITEMTQPREQKAFVSEPHAPTAKENAGEE